MHKFTKIAVSFLLILSIILNPLGSVFDVRADAVAPVIIEGIKYVVIELVKVVAGSAFIYFGSEAINVSAEAAEAAQKKQESALNALEKGVGVELIPSVVDEYGNYHDAYYSASLIEGVELTAEEKEFADYFINYVNSHPDEFAVTLEAQADGTYKFNLTPSQYEEMRNSVADSYNEWLLNKVAEETKDKAILDMLDNGVLPVYDFSFVGPQPSISSPVYTGLASLMKDGFIYTPPISSSLYNEKSKLSTDCTSTYSSGLDNVSVSGNDASGYQFTGTFTGYSGGEYIVYNGNIYYKQTYGYTSDSHTRTVSSRLIPSSAFGNFYASDGTCLADVYTTGSYSQGFFYNLTGEVQAGKPTVDVLEDDFNVTAGGSVEIPRTDDEDLIGQALGLGLINPDSTLEFNEDGTIAGADGMELAKLQELIDLIASGQLSFENIQEYLDIITKLVASGNLTDTQQKTILENLKELEESQAKSIDEINSAVTSIAAALTIEGDINLDIPDVTIIDKFPFCLPFDVYYIFTLLCQEPKEPIFEIPIKTTIETGGLNYEIDEEIILDLTIFRLNGYDMVQIFTQSSITLLFVLCLIVATKKLMWK